MGFQVAGVHGSEIRDGKWVSDVHNDLTLHLGRQCLEVLRVVYACGEHTPRRDCSVRRWHDC